MLIIKHQNHHDYYDVISKNGVDTSIIWHRTPKDVEYSVNDNKWTTRPSKLKPYPFPRFNTPYRSWCVSYNSYLGKNREYINPTGGGIIGFCGKLYPFFMFNDFVREDRDRRGNLIRVVNKDVCYYHADDIREHFVKYANNDQLKRFDEVSKIKNDFRPSYSDFSTWLYKVDSMENDKEVQSLFQDYKVPVFYARRTSHTSYITFNYDDLNKFNFYKVVDPYQAFQRIQMFISNAVTVKPMPVISDELKAESKGFDKYSFRNTPNSKPNRKRKLNEKQK